MIKVTQTNIPEILIIEPTLYDDNRGHFYESFNQDAFEKIIGQKIDFIQDNHAHSYQNVLRGLHYQLASPQDKLIRVIQGEVLDVAVDIRKSSATFGHYVATHLSAENKKQMWIPKGFAHGFLTISHTSDVIYKLTTPYDKKDDFGIIWNDKDINISWPLISHPILSMRDQNLPSLREAKVFDEAR